MGRQINEMVKACYQYNKTDKAQRLMFCVSDQSHYQFILRSSQEIDKQRKKFSAGYKRRNKIDRQKEKEKSNVKLMHYQSEQIRKKKNQSQLEHEISHSTRTALIGDNTIKLLSSQNALKAEAPRKKNPQFSLIMENIKDILKSSDKQTKETNEFKNKFNLKDEFLCLRTRLHQQLYKSELRDDHFRSKEIEQSIIEMKRYARYETTNSSKKYVCNPFVASNTVTCNSAVLNEPISLKRPPQLDINPTLPPAKSITSRKTSNITKALHKRTMTFQLNSDGDLNYQRKIKSYLDFLFKVNFSNNIYVNLDINYEEYTYGATRYKVFIGRGNNSQLVKSIIKRRFWWEITNNIDDKDIMFYWSQSKLDRILSFQKTSKRAKVPNTFGNKKAFKVSDDILLQNRKLLPLEKQSAVEQYLTPEGFTIPFQETFLPDIITNHLPKNNSIGSKKNLFKSLSYYYKNIAGKNPFDYIPKTYHVHSRDGQQFQLFCNQNAGEPNKVWIIKPGQNTNRGNSIQLAPFNKIQQCMTKQKHQNGDPFTYIIQSYINKPFLYNNRKFDIRHYILLTSVNGALKCYWYKQGYIRTSSEQFDISDLGNKFIHLTNDAIQKYCQNYEKHEPANKLSYNEFQRYLDYNFPNKNYHFEDILVKMKEMALDIIKANYLILDHKRLKNNFEVFGLDFMIDRQWKPWLIQVNYNPCLEVNCPVLQRVIPGMLQNTLRLALDPIFPPPCHFPSSKRFYLADNYLKNLKYQLIFDEESLKDPIKNAYIYEDGQEEDEQYQDQGHGVTDIHL